MFMEERLLFQDYIDGKNDDIDVFTVKNEDVLIIGLNAGDRIRYYIPIDDRTTLCLIGVNMMSSLIEAISDISGQRIDALEPHLPSFFQALSDCVDNRYDRGAFAKLFDYWFLVRKVDFGMLNRMQEKSSSPIEVLADDILLGAFQDLDELLGNICEEIDKWEGFGTWDELKIQFREALPGIRMGLRLGRFFS